MSIEVIDKKNGNNDVSLHCKAKEELLERSTQSILSVFSTQPGKLHDQHFPLFAAGITK